MAARTSVRAFASNSENRSAPRASATPTVASCSEATRQAARDTQTRRYGFIYWHDRQNRAALQRRGSALLLNYCINSWLHLLRPRKTRQRGVGGFAMAGDD